MGFIITARKRSLGQGNMFTGVCLCTGGGVCSRGVHGPGEGVCSREGGGLLQGGCLVETPGGYCCGRYASYWNAFFVFTVFLLLFSGKAGVRRGNWIRHISSGNRNGRTLPVQDQRHHRQSRGCFHIQRYGRKGNVCHWFLTNVKNSGGSREQEDQSPPFLYSDQEKMAIEKISFSWSLSLLLDPLLFENKCLI